MMDIFVRLIPSGQPGRRITFPRPMHIPVKELLANQYAIDGNQCMIDVLDNKKGKEFFTQLTHVEQELISFLADHGISEVEFK